MNPETLRRKDSEFGNQHTGVCIPLRSRSWLAELACLYQQLADTRDSVGSKKSELERFLEYEGEFELHESLLDVEGVGVCHGGE